MNVSPFLAVSHSCEAALQWVTGQLLQAGLRPVQTFDLHAARKGVQDCPCPNHGTHECDCQFVVMLVYGKSGGPVTLILHGNDGQTWLSIAEGPHPGTEMNLSTEIKQALESAPDPVSRAG